MDGLINLKFQTFYDVVEEILNIKSLNIKY